LTAISRETVDGARPNPAAIDRIDLPSASPREISSHSSNDNRNRDRSGTDLDGRCRRFT
jgi:hypothetical protein